MHVLGFKKGLKALLAQLARAARELHAAERPGVVVGQWVVDPAGVGLDLLVVLLDLLGVAGVQIRIQAVVTIVRQHGRLVEEATLELRWVLAVGKDLGILRARLFDMIFDLAAVALADQWTDI